MSSGDIPEKPAGHHHDLGFELPGPATLRSKHAVRIAVGVAVVLLAGFLVGYLPGRQKRVALAEASDAAEKTGLRVEVVTPKVSSSVRALSLPGSVQPLQETVLYARASGYVRKWYVDIGDKVTEGQLLAELETPELDHQIDQARAQLAQGQAQLVQAKANRDLAAANLERYKQLTPSGVVSKAELDQKQAEAAVGESSVSVSQSTIAAEEANLRVLTQLKSFSRVTAPFAGKITQRWVEIGALVTAGNGQPLYKVGAMDPLRVFVQVPQDVAPSVRDGLSAGVSVREYPGRVFPGTIARSAGELDPATRTMNTEVRVANTDGALIAGMYAEVTLTLASPHHVFELPATALMNDSKGQRVAVIDDESKVHLVPVVVERDTGLAIEVSSGLTGTERIAKLGSAEFGEGRTVEVLNEGKPVEAPHKP